MSLKFFRFLGLSGVSFFWRLFRAREAQGISEKLTEAQRGSEKLREANGVGNLSFGNLSWGSWKSELGELEI